MVPACSNATSRSFGCFPPSGTPDSAASSGQLNRSRVVPSKMTSSRPNAVPPAASGTSSRAASSSKARRIGCSPSRVLAWDNADPVGTGVPGRTRVPGIENALARIMS